MQVFRAEALPGNGPQDFLHCFGCQKDPILAWRNRFLGFCEQLQSLTCGTGPRRKIVLFPAKPGVTVLDGLVGFTLAAPVEIEA